MSGAGPKVAPQPWALPKERTPLAHLLHALNQPLTGLQCSLELATAGPRPADQYVRTLREGLDLVSRMRALVEAIREIAQPSSLEEPVQFRLETLLFDAAAELQPVAGAKNVRIRISANSALPVRADRSRLAILFFRLLDSAVSLCRDQNAVQITAQPEHNRACITVSWAPGPAPEHSPFSRPELGLLIAQTGWEQAGGSWIEARTEQTETCILTLPMSSGQIALTPLSHGDLK